MSNILNGENNIQFNNLSKIPYYSTRICGIFYVAIQKEAVGIEK